MFEDRDHYAAFYAHKLWALLPAADRDADGDPGRGVLRELVARLGAQIAETRRLIDRSWEDAFVETSDDWLIPFHGELLATVPIAGLDARAQRLDVARSIYYRRRQGTLPLVEELAVNIAGWNARGVEFFRRLARTRHGFDPAIGQDREMALLQGLAGARSATPAGGFADLRDVAAAGASRSAFDEFAHTADFRRGRGAIGWHSIPKLGLFLWRLRSFAAPETTPVEHAGCPGQYTFDPTGREIALFARDVRDPAQYRDTWVTPDRWMLPGPIDAALLEDERERLVPASLAVLRRTGALLDTLGPAEAEIDPARGRIRLLSALPAAAATRVAYHYGLMGSIGAHAIDRRALAHDEPVVTPLLPETSGGEGAIGGIGAVLGAPQRGTITLSDSLTYTALPALDQVEAVLVRAATDHRAVLRPPIGADWVVTGSGPDARLTLDGVLLSGVDLIVRGQFAELRIVNATLDPGEAQAAGQTVPRAIDDRPLTGSTIWIEGVVARVSVIRSICGAIRTRASGLVLDIATDRAIVQAVSREPRGGFGELYDARALARRWKQGGDPLTVALVAGFPPALTSALAAYDPDDQPDVALVAAMRTALDDAVAGPRLWQPALFAHVPLPPTLADGGPDLDDAASNRALIAATYPAALALAAVAADDAHLTLERTTVLGDVYAQRISANGAILAGFARANDTQNGCVRFSASEQSSRLHRPYQSVTMRAGARPFTSRRFGDPGYAQLGETADAAILDPVLGGSIASGGVDGVEMGAFAEEAAALRRRGLRRKLDAHLPVGMVPVLINAT